MKHDEPTFTTYRPGEAPQAEPEYPQRKTASAEGWTEMSDTYHAPARATKAIIELYLQWQPNARVEWKSVLSMKLPPCLRASLD